MSQLFLTSSAHTVAHDIPRLIDLLKGNRLVFIDTASEPFKAEGDTEWLENDRKALVDAGFDVTDFTITGKTKSEITTFLLPFDFIYCSGGHTAHLLTESYTSGFVDVVQDLVNEKGKIYIGTSAGSIIAGPKLPPYFYDEAYPDVEQKPAFGLVHFTVVPHWGSEDFREKYLRGRMEQAYREDQPPYILLNDNQYIHVKHGWSRIIDVKQ